MTGRGHDVHVLACRADKGKSFTEFRSEATVHRLRSHGVPTHEYFRICFPWEIKKEISLLFDRVKPDVVHIQSHYMIGEHVLYEAVKRGVRIVATNHFMPENLNPFLPFPQWFKDIIGTHLLEGHGQGHGPGRRRHHAHAAGRQGDAPARLPAQGAAALQRHRLRCLRAPARGSRSNATRTPRCCSRGGWPRRSTWTC